MNVWYLSAAKSWAEDGGEAGYTDAMELLDLGLHLIGDESEEVCPQRMLHVTPLKTPGRSSLHSSLSSTRSCAHDGRSAGCNCYKRSSSSLLGCKPKCNHMMHPLTLFLTPCCAEGVVCQMQRSTSWFKPPAWVHCRLRRLDEMLYWGWLRSWCRRMCRG